MTFGEGGGGDDGAVGDIRVISPRAAHRPRGMNPDGASALGGASRLAPFLNHDHDPTFVVAELGQLEPRIRRSLTRPKLSHPGKKLVSILTLHLGYLVVGVQHSQLRVILEQPVKTTRIEPIAARTSKSPLDTVCVRPTLFRDRLYPRFKGASRGQHDTHWVTK